MNKLSATIITLNEEKYLPGCLDSIKNITEDIVVVDSGSTDRTVDIAHEYGAKVYVRNFDYYAKQKNYAASKTSGAWILSLDADERIEKDLAREIVEVVTNPKPGIVAYSIPRKNIIFGKFIKYSRWQPELDRHIWLWKKGFGVWKGKVHEEVEAKGEVGELKNAKIHHQYENVKDFMVMMNNYSDLDAVSRVEKGIGFSFFQLIISPIYNFLVRFFYRLGFLDGWRGFMLSYLMAVYHLELWIKVWEKKNAN